jgi:hypothetical protein
MSEAAQRSTDLTVAKRRLALNTELLAEELEH